MEASSYIRAALGSRAGLLTFVVIAALASPHWAQQQKIFDPPQPILDYRCPTYTLPGGGPIVMRAEIIGAKDLPDEQQSKGIRFSWELSAGKLLDGQGTGKVTVDTSDIKNEIGCIDLKLRLEGAPPYMEIEKTCTLRIDPKCNAPALFDQYKAISDKEEQEHLDRVAAYLKHAGSEPTLFVVSYAGRSACHYEAQWRVDRIKNYLIGKYNLPQDRVIVVDGGFRENWTIDLFVQAEGSCGPIATPELLRSEVKVSGECSEKYNQRQASRIARGERRKA